MGHIDPQRTVDWRNLMGCFQGPAAIQVFVPDDNPSADASFMRHHPHDTGNAQQFVLRISMSVELFEQRQVPWQRPPTARTLPLASSVAGVQVTRMAQTAGRRPNIRRPIVQFG